MKRKPRSDRNHLVYKAVVGSMTYIGVTVVKGSDPDKSLRRRFQRHVQRALTEQREWALCRAIRQHGSEKFSLQIISVVRGKSAAHTEERKLIRKLNPKLNTDKR